MQPSRRFIAVAKKTYHGVPGLALRGLSNAIRAQNAGDPNQKGRGLK